VLGIGYAITYVFEKGKSDALDKLQEQNIALRDLNQEKNNFLTIVAHDLKNPLASVRTFAEVSAHPATTPEKRQQYLQNIAKTSDRMFELVKNLLDVNLIESGQITLRTSRINLNELIKDYLAQISQLATIRKIQLQQQLPSHAVYLTSDVRRLEQVLENYLSNALKYSPPDTTVSIRLTEEPQFIEISVVDEGEGISIEEQGKLFKAFGVTTAVPRDGEHKLGLGLAIVKKVGNELQAETGCRSEKGKGTEFFIRFNKPA
jgi:signal transduction histidine kinase